LIFWGKYPETQRESTDKTVKEKRKKLLRRNPQSNPETPSNKTGIPNRDVKSKNTRMDQLPSSRGK